MTYCCEVFPKIAKSFVWRNKPYLRFLRIGYYSPKLHIGGRRSFVNFCPSCGADIRGIVITKDEFDKLK